MAKLVKRAFILKLEKELREANEQLNNCGRVKPQFLMEPDSDEYQDQLELSWYKDELSDTIERLEERIDRAYDPIITHTK
jgi:hypothetical protein